MTSAENHIAAQAQTEMAVNALMRWVAEAEKSLTNDKLDGTARARVGELLVNACRYLAEREVAAKKERNKSEYDARPSTIAMNKRISAAGYR